MFKNVKRIAYQVSDVEKAREWYVNVLEREPAFDSPIAAIFRIGENSLTLAKGSPDIPEDTGRISVYWEVEDVDHSFDQLVEMGATAKSPPDNVLNTRTAQVVDPFGNVIGLTGPVQNAEFQNVENKPSETAHAVALCRSLASHDIRFGTQTSDLFSKLFLKEDIKPVLLEESSRNALINRNISRPLYGFFIARSLFMDEVFIRALQAQIPQIVFLGAGYDTRALRFQRELGKTHIFELDVPSTQGRKLQILQMNQISAPSQLQYVSVNFKTDSFLEQLQNQGFNSSLATLFIWEGVTYYLPQEVMDQTLDLIKHNSAPGSSIAFDYMTTKLESTNMNEPFLSWISPEKIPDYLQRFGFQLVDHLDEPEMVRRYLTLDNGTVAENTIPTIRLVYAELANT